MKAALLWQLKPHTVVTVPKLRNDTIRNCGKPHDVIYQKTELVLFWHGPPDWRESCDFFCLAFPNKVCVQQLNSLPLPLIRDGKHLVTWILNFLMLYLLSYISSTEEQTALLGNLQGRKLFYRFYRKYFHRTFFSLFSLSLSLTTNNCILLELRKITIRIGLNDCGSVRGAFTF